MIEMKEINDAYYAKMLKIKHPEKDEAQKLLEPCLSKLKTEFDNWKRDVKKTGPVIELIVCEGPRFNKSNPDQKQQKILEELRILLKEQEPVFDYQITPVDAPNPDVRNNALNTKLQIKATVTIPISVNP